MITKKFVLPLILVLALVIPLTGCNDSLSDDGLSGALDITGSNTVTPVTTIFAEAFMSMYPGVNISVSGPGSGAGIAALINRTTDICQSSRSIRESEINQAAGAGVDVVKTRVATDAIAVIVHPSNPVSELTIQQLSDIYSGKITNWSEVGGDDKTIVVLSRDTNSGTHVYFKEAVVQMRGLPGEDRDLEYGERAQFLPSTSVGVSEVAGNPNGIFYIGLGYLDDSVKALGVKSTEEGEAVIPSLETALDNTYQIARGLFYYTDGQPAGLIKEFIDFALSDQGQQIVEDVGFVPVK